MEKVKAIEPDFYSVNSVLSKNKALCLCVSVFHSIFRKPILFYYKTLNGNKQRNLPDLSMSGRQYNCDTGTITNRATLRLLIVQRDDY